ncbi:hypothetical protein Syun_005749 [Stephania yunnanensis]|uniref:Uncharacterized protein n=1 Tax=Stephania yunnanensis TaxID=152371 RepID=A0AAP0KWT3_9MAGN
MERDNRFARSHVLVLAYPSQGHINPVLQFAKRLIHKGLKVTLVLTVHNAKSLQTKDCPIPIETISDGFDETGSKGAESIEAYFSTFEAEGSRTLGELIEKHQSSDDHDPVSCVVYDSFLIWVLDVVKKYGVLGAPFFTQAAHVNSIYYHAQMGLLQIPLVAPVSVPAMPPLEVSDLPSFVSDRETTPFLLTLLVNQFINLDRADWVLVNTFDKLEQEASGGLDEGVVAN